ncbi:hypothetical protein [Erythrobacter alti]|uniref:hypothetical protein n=1 Tax=Erythrobacter alti TaxID=1896145 RepID=UPI0030F4048E
MLRVTITGIALLATACGEAPPDAEIESENAAVVDRVREANEAGPPLGEVIPETITYPDIEANDLLGLACSYAPGTSMGVRVIARETDAYMKIDDEMVRFAADPGSRELPAKTRSLYNGRLYSLRLNIEEPMTEGEIEGTTHEGTMWLYDRWDRVVYTGTGTVNCGA